MKKYLHLLWIVPVLFLSGLWLFGNLLNEIRYFGLFNPDYGVLSGEYPTFFYVASAASLLAFPFTLYFIYTRFFHDR